MLRRQAHLPCSQQPQQLYLELRVQTYASLWEATEVLTAGGEYRGRPRFSIAIPRVS